MAEAQISVDDMDFDFENSPIRVILTREMEPVKKRHPSVSATFTIVLDWKCWGMIAMLGLLGLAVVNPPLFQIILDAISRLAHAVRGT